MYDVGFVSGVVGSDGMEINERLDCSHASPSFSASAWLGTCIWIADSAQPPSISIDTRLIQS